MSRLPKHKRDASRRVWLWHEDRQPEKRERFDDEEPPEPDEVQFPAWLLKLLGLEA